MRFDVNIVAHIYNVDPDIRNRLDAIDGKQDRVLKELEMAKYGDAATLAAVKEVLARINDATNAIAAKIQALTDRLAAKIQALTDRLNAPGLTEAETNEIKTDLAALQAQLESLAADPENPVPDPV